MKLFGRERLGDPQLERIIFIAADMKDLTNA